MKKLTNKALPKSRTEKAKLYYLLLEKKRRRLQKDFYAFCVYMDPKFFTPEKSYLKLIASVYQFVALGLILRVILSMPPRAGKSYITSLFCAWLIGKDKEGAIMRNSYAAGLAHKFSYDIRAIIQLDKYLFVFPDIRLKYDKKAVDDWAIEGSPQSTYFCGGTGGALTGKGCNKVAILDDPIKNMEVALSETQLETVWQWYTSTHKTRMEANCPEIHIATRWSKKDPIGRIKEKYGTVTFDQFLSDPEKHKNSWVEIVIKGLEGKGAEVHSFCEAVRTTAQYLEDQETMDDFVFKALIQQEPIDIKGVMLPASELNYFEEDEFLKYENSLTDYWDAITGYTDTADEGGDHLASLTGKIKGDYIYITDVVFTMEPIEITEPRVAQMIIDTGTNKHVIESNAGGRSFAKNIRGLIKGLSRCTIISRANTVNKETRIIMKSGQVKKHFKFRKSPQPGSDYKKFMDYLTSYEILSGKRDDAIDATVGLAETVFERGKLEAMNRL